MLAWSIGTMTQRHGHGRGTSRMRDILDPLADPDLGPALPATMLGIALAILLLILVHEGGHVLFGRLAGYRIRTVRIGRGPTLFRLHIGLALLDWRLLPISGAVAVYQPFVRCRSRRLLLSAGGCLANVAVAGVLAALLPWPPDVLAHPVVGPVLLAQMAGLLNLMVVPRRLGRTDGTIFLAALQQPSAPNRGLIDLYRTSVGARYHSLPPASPSPLGAVVLHALLLGTPAADFGNPTGLATVRALRERDRLRHRLLATEGLTAAERAVLLHAQVLDALLGGTRINLDQLNAWSDELAALLPEEPSARAARGAVLVLAGRLEGRSLLDADLAADASSFERGVWRAFLARAALDDGDRVGATQLLAAARVDLAVSPEGEDFPLMVGLRAELAGGSTPSRS